MQSEPSYKTPVLARLLSAIPVRARLPLAVAGGIAAFVTLALVAVNILISAEWVRDRVAARIKEETGRDLRVNGATALLFTPGPRIIITDATITDPTERVGTADLEVGRLDIALSLGELLSRQVDAESVVLVRPVLTMRLGAGTGPDRRSEESGPAKPRRYAKAAAGSDEDPHRDIRLNDVRIEDGTVNLVYENGKQRRIEHIDAKLSLPAVTEPFVGSGQFDWKEQTVKFSFELVSIADLRDKRPARLLAAVDTPAIATRFDGSVLTRPRFSGQGELSAKAHSIPSLLAWMRERPAAEAAIGDGELASHVAWKEDEVAFSNARFALQHATGQGEAVVSFDGPRPHIRAAFALDSLDLNPFLASNAPRATGTARKAAREAVASGASARTKGSDAAKSKPEGDWFTKPDDAGRKSGEEIAAPAAAEIPISPPPSEEPAPNTGPAPADPQVFGDSASAAQVLGDPVPVAPQSLDDPAAVSVPAAFDADINLNVRKTRVSHLDIGPSSLGLTFRDGVLDATLGGMELYEGNAGGKLRLDASKPVPAFSADFRLDGVQARPLLSDAAQFSLLSGRTKLKLTIAGSGSNAEEIKSSLQGQGSVAVSEGAIEGINITELIGSIGAGRIPDMRQGPGARTAFSDLGGSFTIAGGIAETNNLQMQAPLLNVKAAGTVNLVEDRLDILTHPEIVPGPEGQGGANDLAGVTVPIRIEGPLDNPRIAPELGGLFADPETAGRTVRQIGDALQKKFQGKPVGEALGRFLGNLQIGGERTEPPASRQDQVPEAPDENETEQNESVEEEDPDIKEILR